MLDMRVEEINSLCNINNGNIITIAGYTGHGKSIYAKNIAYYSALQGQHVVYIDFDIPIEVGKNIFLKIHNYQNTNVNFNEKIGKNLTYIHYNNESLTMLKKQLNELQIKHPIDLIIIDSFTLLKYCKPYFSFMEYFRYFQEIKSSFSSKPNIILLSYTSNKGVNYARNRGKQNEREEGTYKIDGILNGTKLNSFSDYIFTIYSSEIMRLRNKIVLQVLKNKSNSVHEKLIETSFLPDHYYIGDITN